MHFAPGVLRSVHEGMQSRVHSFDSQVDCKQHDSHSHAVSMACAASLERLLWLLGPACRCLQLCRVDPCCSCAGWQPATSPRPTKGCLFTAWARELLLAQRVLPSLALAMRLTAQAARHGRCRWPSRQFRCTAAFAVLPAHAAQRPQEGWRCSSSVSTVSDFVTTIRSALIPVPFLVINAIRTIAICHLSQNAETALAIHFLSRSGDGTLRLILSLKCRHVKKP